MVKLLLVICLFSSSIAYSKVSDSTAIKSDSYAIINQLISDMKIENIEITPIDFFYSDSSIYSYLEDLRYHDSLKLYFSDSDILFMSFKSKQKVIHKFEKKLIQNAKLKKYNNFIFPCSAISYPLFSLNGKTALIKYHYWGISIYKIYGKNEFNEWHQLELTWHWGT
jgi:hypothetical protein